AAEGAEAEAVEGAAEGTPEGETGEDAVKSTTVLEHGAIYPIESNMTMYADASADSDVVMELPGDAGWSVAIENPAEAGNGWHYVSVWLQGAATYGYIQIP
ncbi:MAG: hypothetical protein Q4D81_00585, partial [Eubacteriales bacterium]|nr:hypothetical protein [Eubacteriales bacterium]